MEREKLARDTESIDILTFQENVTFGVRSSRKKDQLGLNELVVK